MGQPPHWADVLTLRQEVTDASGQVANLQISLYSVVSRTADVPYRDVGYFGDITMPTSGLVNFIAQVAQRLGLAGSCWPRRSSEPTAQSISPGPGWWSCPLIT